jgi:hypothetical protein
MRVAASKARENARLQAPKRRDGRRDAGLKTANCLEHSSARGPRRLIEIPADDWSAAGPKWTLIIMTVRPLITEKKSVPMSRADYTRGGC